MGQGKASQEVDPDDWQQLWPALASQRDASSEAVKRSARLVYIPAGTVLFHDGDRCSHYMLVIEGTVRVQKVAESGREIILYRVERGESCVLTTSCLLGKEHYPAEGIAETDVKAVIFPEEAFLSGLTHSPAFREFVFTAYSRRISSLILLLEEVAFRRVDARLADCLLRRTHGSSLTTTHQALAVELGTAREVVSRQLKEFERRGWITLSRGRIEILDRAALEGASAAS